MKASWAGICAAAKVWAKVIVGLRGRSLASNAVPVADSLTLRYALHELPPGRLPFRRWRWELWHGARLEGTGWRLSERDASRAVQRHGALVGQRLLGLGTAPPPAPRELEPFRPGTTVHVRGGGVFFSLVPLHLEEPDLS